MSDVFVIACATAAVLALFAELVLWPMWQAERDDWRDEWCVPECWAPDGQERPCDDCPCLRATMSGNAPQRPPEAHRRPLTHDRD